MPHLSTLRRLSLGAGLLLCSSFAFAQSEDPCSDLPPAPASGWAKLLASAASAGEPPLVSHATSAEIFTDYAARPDSHPQIANYSFAGYRRGEVPVPDLPVVATLTDFGGVGDGVFDNTEAFRAAIEAAHLQGGGAVLVPPGNWFVHRLIILPYSGVVLRGSGVDETRITFRRSLKAVLGQDITGSGNSKWSWQGGLIWISPPAQLRYDPFQVEKTYLGTGFGDDWTLWWGGGPWQGPRLANVSAPAARGDWEVEVTDASALRPGQTYLLCWRNLGVDDSYSLFKHIAGHPLMANFHWAGAGGLNARKQFQWPVEVLAVEGRRVRLAQPLRIDIRPEWQVGFEPIGPVVEDSGVEDLTVTLEGAPLITAHNFYDGWNAFFFTKAVNTWVRRVVIENAENAILSRSTKNLLMADITLRGTVRLHHGNTVVRGHDSMLDGFDWEQPVHHGISVEDLATGNVSRRGRMDHGTFDSHRFMSFDLLRTDVDLFNDGGPGGASDFGPFVGKNVVHWNISLRQNKGLYVFQPDAHSRGALVGIRGANADTSNAWAMVPGDKDNLIADIGELPSPSDLWVAQRDLRATQRGWVTWADPLTDFVPSGDVPLAVGVALPGGQAPTAIEFRANGALVATTTGVVDGVARATWPAVVAGGYTLEVTVRDALGRTFSPPAKAIGVGTRVRVEDNSPRWRLAGGNWTTRTDARHSGGTGRTNTNRDTVFAELRFVGTRVRLYAAENNSDSKVDVYLDELAVPRAGFTYASRNNFRVPIFDSGPLAPGLHTLRVVSRQAIGIDFAEVDEIGEVPALTPPVPVLGADVLTGPAPLRVRFDAGDSAVPAGLAERVWNFGNGTTSTAATAEVLYGTPGVYRVNLSLRDLDGAVEGAETYVRVLPASTGQPDRLARIVNWGGEVITATSDFRGVSATRTDGLDLDGDGSANDSRHSYPFRLDVPLSPSAGYLQQPFFGGITQEIFNGYIALSERRVMDNFFNDRISVRGGGSSGRPARMGHIFFWQKGDFHGAGDRYPVAFGAGASLLLSGISSFENLGQGRWLVREGNQFYLSEVAMAPVSGTARLDFAAGGDGLWAPVDPAAGFAYNPTALAYEQMTFREVTAVGFWTWREVPTEARQWLAFSNFQVEANVYDDVAQEAVAGWRERFFTGTELADGGAEATVWGDLADPDGDGVSNLAEYYFGLSPRTASAIPTSVVVPPGGLPRFRYHRARGHTGVVGTLEWSADLITWSSDQVVEEVVAEEPNRLEIEAQLPVSAQDLFIRWRVQRR